MNLCRICLSSSTDRDICELKTSKDDSKSYSEILSFCLDIKVLEKSKFTTKLCSKCFKKILSYHKFKTLALQNDTYLKSVNLNCAVKLEIFEDEQHSNNNCDLIQTYTSDTELSDDNFLSNNVKEEAVEIDTNAYQSDNELLSVIKNIKEEDPSGILDVDSTTVLDPKIEDRVITKRSRPKKIKTEGNVSIKQICEECGESVSDIKQHSIKHKPLNERKQIPCKVCEKTFSSYGARNKHNRVKHLGIKYQCELCSKEVTNLRDHILRVHNPDKMKIICMLCDKRFISQSLLKFHMLSHTKDKPYECDICFKAFRSKVIMMHHKRQVHENEKSHLCQYCSKRFFKKYHLQIHLRSHTKEKPYKCDECGRAFSCVTTLKKHKETHNTEKNYQCEHCDMKFVRRAYLRVHMVCHTKEKRYPCKYCGLRFGRSDHRKRHQFTAHEKHLLAA